MTLDRMVMAFAGLLILVSLTLAELFSPYWLLPDGARRTEPDPVFVHRILPRRALVQAPRRPDGSGVLITGRGPGAP